MDSEKVTNEQLVVEFESFCRYLQAGGDEVHQKREVSVRLLLAVYEHLASTEALREENEQAKKDSFHHGYLIAVANIVHLHDEPTVARDVLQELGVTEGEIKRLDLCDYDAKPLRKLFREISRLNRNERERARKALDTEGAANGVR